MKRKTYLILWLAILSCAFSCQNKNVIYKYHINIPNKQWHRDNQVLMRVSVPAKVEEATILLSLRYSQTYPYNNLKLEVTSENPHQDLNTATYTVPIKDKSGRNMGEGMGDLWDLEMVLFEQVSLEAGLHTYEIAHLMDTPLLPMILSVGLIVEK